MKKLFTLVFLLIGLQGKSQITVTTSDMPVSGDTIRLSTASPLSTVDLTLTGANFTWDFTALVPDSQVVDTFLAVSSTGALYSIYFSAFLGNPANSAHRGPDLSLIPGVPLTNAYVFYNKNSSLYEQVGFGATYNALQIPVGFTNKDVIYNFPLNFNDADSSDSNFSISLTGTGSLSGTQHRVNHVDGWGSLQTAYGTFNVLRVVSEITAHDSLYLDTLSMGFGFDQPLSREYKWIGKNKSLPLMQINTQFVLGTETITSIRYRDSVRVIPTPTGIASLENESNHIQLFPNPSSGNSMLRFFSDNNKPVTISILDLSGREFRSKDYVTVKGTNEFVLSSSNLSSGIYFIKVKQGEKNVETLRWAIDK